MFGIQISELTNEGLDEHALLIAGRNVVIFRDQNFKDLKAEKQIEIGHLFVPLFLLTQL